MGRVGGTIGRRADIQTDSCGGDRRGVMAHYYDPNDPYLVPPGVIVRDDSPLERYRAELAYTDWTIGELLQGLSEAGRMTDTVVVLFGDHGESFGDHGGMTHGTSVYDEIVHVPLLFYVPGTRPRQVETVVSLVDIAPTVLALTGFEGRMKTHQSISRAPAMAGEPLRQRPVYAEGIYKGIQAKWMIIDRDRKLIWDGKNGFGELYHLGSDPGETRNLINSEPMEAARLKTALCDGLKMNGRLDVAPSTREQLYP